MPTQTLAAVKHHGSLGHVLSEDVGDAQRVLDGLSGEGISLDRATAELEREGVKAFADAWTALLELIDVRRADAVSTLGPLSTAVSDRARVLEAMSVPRRLWAGDASLWTSDPAEQSEVKQRLGWLTLPSSQPEALSEVRGVADSLRNQGITDVIVIGMGGSSLAAEVFDRLFGDRRVRLTVLDTVDPAEISAIQAETKAASRRYLVSSKSGATVEVEALLDHFWSAEDRDGSRFIAISDPGTRLAGLARERGFRHIFAADPTVGGRYSALSLFGLVPAAIVGIDPQALLHGAVRMQRQCGPDTPAAGNPGLTLGAVLAEAALSGRNKLTFLADEPIEGLGAWIEQLLAESTGKAGKGIVPVDLEPTAPTDEYSKDRLFVYLRRTGGRDALVSELCAGGHPAVKCQVDDAMMLAAEMYRWQFATAVASHVFGVNAFDQPDVRLTKERTRSQLEVFARTGSVTLPTPRIVSPELRIFAERMPDASGAEALLRAHVLTTRPGDYVAVNAFLPRNAEVRERLAGLRAQIRALNGCPTTLGYGPRFLHSAGQLQKGGPDGVIILQITVEPAQDLPVSGGALTFGVLQMAQAMADYESLVTAGRRVVWVHLQNLGALNVMMEALR